MSPARKTCSAALIREVVPAPRAPTRLQRAARRLLALFGWRIEIVWPPTPRCVIVFYPHTSNWDFVIGLIARFSAGLPVQWVGKDTLFRRPFGTLLERMGGIPVNRREHTGFIRQLAAEFERRPWMWLVIAPEGTRSRTDHWKSGFYHLALAARSQVGLAFIDYQSRTLGLTAYLALSGDEDADLKRMRAFYADKTGRHPGQAGEIRFRAEG